VTRARAVRPTVNPKLMRVKSTRSTTAAGSKKVLYLDMDNVLVDFMTGVRALDARTQKRYEGRLDKIPGVFALMQPMEGAVDAYHRLRKLFDTYIASTAPWENPSAWQDKREWVDRHLGPAARKRLILTHHKNLLRGDFIVDDRTKRGVDRFQGMHIHFGKGEFKDWESVVKFLEGQA
jgi:5'-nucleotidase